MQQEGNEFRISITATEINPDFKSKIWFIGLSSFCGCLQGGAKKSNPLPYFANF